MLFRVLYRFIEAKSYFHHYFFLLSAKIEPFENDHSRFKEVLFNLLIFKPLCEIFKFISFCLNISFFIFSTLLKANNIVLRFIFIKVPTNMLFFYLLFDYKLTYIFIEFVFMFVSSYILSFKSSIKLFIFETKQLSYDFFGYPEGYGSFAMEIYPDEYQEYLDSFENIPGPDLNVYYPMRFALSSIMIRLTGIILASSFLFILILNFANLFIIIDANFNELKRALSYKELEFIINNYFFYKKYFLSNTYNTATFYSTIKCILIILYTTIKGCFKYLFFDAYTRFSLIETFKIKYLILNFFYNFFSYIFILILPIHFYYVVYHSYKLIYISTYIGYLFDYLKTLIKFFFKILIIVLKKIWNIIYLIATVEEPDVHAKSNIEQKDNNKNEQKENNQNELK